MSSLRLSRLVPLLLLSILAACGGSRPRPQSTPGAPAPAAAVERFLRLAAEKDYAEMGWLFGTTEGPVIRRDPPGDVERRMYALASVLEHTEFSIRGQEPVPGRTGGAVRLTVQLAQRGRRVDVPFVAVRGPEQRWYVEQVGVEALTNTNPPASR
ncbi:MAG TPA: hypothetical protein VHG28_17510 [Longimicrobiaceae bacterium]|nr:hypothetical protein [Longimicrobiaceae bacterium]